jgi:ABC-type cobalamin/Fe3+-siderophores transport system ATPase subunit
MIISYQYAGKKYRFISKDKKNDSDNIYTVIVGKNGSGKSRLLSSIVSTLLGRTKYDMRLGNEIDFRETARAKLDTTSLPSKIITVSTSPFDRFPLNKKSGYNGDYIYLGLRDLAGTNFSISYMSKITASLISVVAYDSRHMDNLSHVLAYLGYNDRITIKLEQRLSTEMTSGLSNFEDPIEALDFLFSKTKYTNPLNRKYFFEQDAAPNADRIYRLFSILGRMPLPIKKEFITIEIDRHGVTQQPGLFNLHPEDISFLIDCGAIRLRDLILYNIKHKNSYSITNASSGEQSVVMSLLGLASQIKDGAVICIDEPEICLHPEWQEKYIQLLISTFRQYKGCHFLIATHSPQIISRLESRDCYVMSMDSGKAISAKSLINNSADFQLANVFNHPGFKNEYLSRIGLNILTKISRNKLFDSEDLSNYNLIETQSEFLEDNDPVLILFNVLREMKQQYA